MLENHDPSNRTASANDEVLGVQTILDILKKPTPKPIYYQHPQKPLDLCLILGASPKGRTQNYRATSFN